MSRLLRLVACFGLLLSAGCSSLPPLPLLTTPTPVSVEQATSTPQSVPTPPTPTATPQARLLRVWLPPRFDPAAGTESANLLRQRLAAFEQQHPDLKVEIRIKAEEGESSLLNSLSITNAAAPAALPDLVALPRPALESAALKGLLHPIDGLSTKLQDPNWYAYARDSYTWVYDTSELHLPNRLTTVGGYDVFDGPDEAGDPLGSGTWPLAVMRNSCSASSLFSTLML